LEDHYQLGNLLNNFPSVQPVTLKGTHVLLEPLMRSHLPELCKVGLDPDLWQWTPMALRTPEEMRTYVEQALEAQELGTALAFVTIEGQSGSIVGSTRYGNIDMVHKGVEIGWTWIAKDWQRTAINTEAKYLMLRHAFESLGCIRVQLKTDSLNERSRAAILRLGAREEGVFRNHMVTYTGRVRHTVYYSIIVDEWPVVKARLEEFLRRSSHQGRSSPMEEFLC
jgi:RimJ/RimL family protein N-acetyltransferase